MEKQFDWKRAAAVSLTVALWCAGAYILFRWAIGLVLPFLLAMLVAAFVRPLAARLSEKLHIRRGVCAFVITLLILSLVILLVVLGCNRLLTEVNRLVEWLGNEAGKEDSPVLRFVEWFRGMGSHIPLLSRLHGTKELNEVFLHLDEMLSEVLSGMVREMSAKLPAMAGSFAVAMPSVFLSTVTFLLACFYFSADDGRISAFVRSVLPASVTRRLSVLAPEMRATAVKYLRAYLLLMAITFGELFIGFSILGMPYAFLPALLVAVVDLLPVFGTGTVIIPWAVFRFLAGDFHTGFGLIILYGVTLLVRQIIEPHVVGGSIGLHPLVTLFSMYVGYRLLGFGGLILGPGTALVLRTLFFPEKAVGKPEAKTAAPVLPGNRPSTAR